MDRIVASRPPADRPGPGLLDPQVLWAACGGDGAILGRICQAFRAGLPDQLTGVLHQASWCRALIAGCR